MPQVTVQEAFQMAVQHHQAGRLREAEQIYRQILCRSRGSPPLADVLHLLGVVSHQMGQSDAGLELIRAGDREEAELSQRV